MRRQVESVEDLNRLVSTGHKVTCPSVAFLETPREAKSLLQLSGKSLLTMLDYGIYYETRARDVESVGLLEKVHAKIRAKGWTQAKIAKKLKIPQQRVNEFLNCSDCKVSTLQKFMDLVRL